MGQLALNESSIVSMSPDELRRAENFARIVAHEDGFDYDRLTEPDRQALLDFVAERMVTSDPDARSLVKSEAWERDYETKPLPIEDWLQSEYHIGKWYYKNLFPAWREEIIEVINRGAIEWIVTGSIGSGKCLAKGSLVNTRSGFVKIEDLYGKHPVVQAESGMRRVETTHDEGVTKTLLVRTKHGHEIEGRSVHRLRVLGVDFKPRWKKLSELQPGDVLLQVPAEEFGTKSLGKAKAELLGWFIAEGCREEGHKKAAINTARFHLHPDELDYVAGLARLCDLGVVNIDTRHNFVSICGHGVRDLFPSATSHHKEIPKAVLHAPREDVCAFLRGLFSGDGHAGVAECSYCTMSKTLADQVRVILTSLGIYCSVLKSKASYKKAGKRKVTGTKYCVRVLGPESLRQFEYEIGFALPEKQAKLQQFAQRWSSNSDHSFAFRLSQEQYAALIEMQPSYTKATCPAGMAKTRTPRGLVHRLKTQRCTVRLLNEIVGADGVLPDVLQKIADGGYLFDTVATVTPSEARCYDLSVKGDPSYVAGGFVSHNTTAAILANLYKLYDVTCMKDPCAYYSSTTVTFGMFSVVKYLAQDVEANMLVTRIMESEYFRKQVGMEKEVDNPRFAKTAALRFPKNIRFTFGSLARHGLGQDIFGGIMDEVAFDDTPDARQVRELYDAVKTRIESRFMTGGGRVPGLLCIVSSANREGDFLDEHIKNSQLSDKIYTSTKAVYHVKSFPGPKFRVLVGDKLHTSRLLDEVYKGPDGKKRVRPLFKADEIPKGVRIEEVPAHWYPRFVKNIEQALRDISGIALFATSPFMPEREKVREASAMHAALPVNNKHPFSIDSPTINLKDDDLTLEKIFLKEELLTCIDRFRNVWQPRVNPGAPRFIHADLAKTGDCVGLACSHLYGFRRVDHVDNQGKAQQIQMPVVYFDFLLQIKPPKGSEIDFTKIISFIFFLRHIGLPVTEVTFDRFQSTHSQQILKKAGFESREISMDRSPAAYMGFKEAVMAACCFFYEYEPLLDELAQLQVLRKVPRGEQTVSKIKIDHPPGGCFVGSTRIPTLDGEHPQIEELVGKETWVYSCMPDGTLVPGKARGRITKMTSELVDVVLDSGAVERCTSDHRWMLRDGTYKAAVDLRPGIDRLMPVNRHWPVNGGYERLSNLHGERVLTHHMVVMGMGEEIPVGWEVHHDNHNKLDNRPENLIVEPPSTHHRRHAEHRWAVDQNYRAAVSAGLRRFNESRDGRRKHSDAMRRTLSKMTAEDFASRARSHPAFRGDITIADVARVRLDAAAETANAAARILGCGRNVVLRVLREHGYTSWDSYRAGEAGDNHKVRAVIPVHLPNPVPVYDLEVDRYHNFALCSGVFVHNSKDVADAAAGAYFACISSKYTELQMAEGPMIDLKKPVETPGRPPANIETGLGSSWIYGDLPEMGHITGIYER